MKRKDFYLRCECGYTEKRKYSGGMSDNICPRCGNVLRDTITQKEYNLYHTMNTRTKAEEIQKDNDGVVLIKNVVKMEQQTTFKEK